MNRIRAAFLPLAIFLLLLPSCAQTPLKLSIPEDLASDWDTLLVDHPLPNKASGEIRLEKTALSRAEYSRTNTANAVIVKETFYARCAYLWETEKESVIKPLEEISLPLRALSEQGLYPDNREYPLREALIVMVDEANPALQQWLNRLRDSEPPLPAVTRIAAVGDIMVGRGVTDLLTKNNGEGLAEVFADTLPHLQNTDLLLGNLEGPVSNKGTKATKSYTFRFNPAVLEPLSKAGFTYLSLANNHSFDYGEEAFLDSLAQLTKAGIGTAGAGSNLAGASIPWMRTAAKQGETETRVLSMSAWPREQNGFDGATKTAATETKSGVLWIGNDSLRLQELAFVALEKAFSPDSFNVVMIHGGAEWATGPSESQRALYKKIVDSGADVVLGAHSHVLQGLEAYNGALIAYSLGNFIFPGMEETKYGEESLILSIVLVNGKPKYVEYVPVEIDRKKIKIDASEKILNRFLGATKSLND